MAKLSLFLIYRNSPRHLLNILSEFQSCACIEVCTRIFLVKTQGAMTKLSHLTLGSTQEKNQFLYQNSLRIKTKLEKMAKFSVFLIHRNSPRHSIGIPIMRMHRSLRANFSRQNARRNTRIKPFNEFFPSCLFQIIP